MTFALLLDALWGDNDGPSPTRWYPVAPDIGEAQDRVSPVPVDAEVIRCINARDAAAFDALVDRYFSRLVRFARTLTTSREAAEDVVQSVLMRVWAHAERWSPSGSVAAYLFRAVRNAVADERARDNVARRYREQVAHAVDLEENPSEDGGTDAQLVATVREALAALPERRRTAVLLRFRDGLSFAEVGAVVGCSERAARELVVRALGTLRRQLAPLR